MLTHFEIKINESFELKSIHFLKSNNESCKIKIKKMK